MINLHALSFLVLPFGEFLLHILIAVTMVFISALFKFTFSPFYFALKINNKV